MTTGLDPRIVRRLADMNAVYRMYGHSGELLYVGMTGQLRRFDNHAMKRWFPQVSRITLEWHPTEAAARVSERRAIRAERPRYNIADTPKAGRSRTRQLPAAIPASRLVLDEEPDRDVLLDVLRVFGDRPGLHWQMLADLLADQIPSRWDGTTKEVVSAQVRAFGVRSICVKISGKTLQGCRRADVEKAATERLLSA